MDLGIAGKRALVCASSKGLGRATAAALVREDVEVFLCARTEAELKEVAAELQSESNRRVHYQVCDMADLVSREALINHIQTVWGGVDILIHNAGGPPPTTVQETTRAVWQTGFETNFLSVVQLNQAFLPGMKARQWGRIVAVTSLSPMEPVPNLAVSNGIRAAVTAMLKTLATEVAADGVCVN
jgi:3-oxoacyl-[acyl-carrier protein] reductase